MTIKQYQLFKTAKKTATVNHLSPAAYGEKTFIDFSLLDEMNLDPDAREKIQADITRHLIPWDRWVLAIISGDFETYSGNAYFVKHNVFSAETGKRLYRICELVKVDLFIGTRSSTWDDFSTESISVNNGHSEPANDIEI